MTKPLRQQYKPDTIAEHMLTQSTEAICLKAQPLAETDLLVTFITPKEGLIRVFARGAKRPNSRFSGACNLFQHSDLYLGHRKNRLILVQYQPHPSFPKIRQEMFASTIAFVLADALMTLLKKDDFDSEILFDAFLNTLRQLNLLAQAAPEAHPDTTLAQQLWALNRFLGFLLRQMGALPQFNHCVSCGLTEAVPERQFYYFSILQGGVFCPTCATQHAQNTQIKVSRQTCHWIKCLQQAPDQAFNTPTDKPEGFNKQDGQRLLRFFWYFIEHWFHCDLLSMHFLMSCLEQY
jgi:DNA repair protein RecO (recombination protein O)